MRSDFNNHIDDETKKIVLRDFIEDMESDYSDYVVALERLKDSAYELAQINEVVKKAAVIFDDVADFLCDDAIQMRREDNRCDISRLFQNWNDIEGTDKSDVLEDVRYTIELIKTEMKGISTLQKEIDRLQSHFDNNRGFKKFKKPQVVYLDGAQETKAKQAPEIQTFEIVEQPNQQMADGAKKSFKAKPKDYNAFCLDQRFDYCIREMKDSFSAYCEFLDGFRSYLVEVAQSDAFGHFRQPIIHAFMEAESNDHITQYNQVNKSIAEARNHWEEMDNKKKEMCSSGVISYRKKIEQKHENLRKLEEYLTTNVYKPGSRRRKRDVYIP